ncbi:MAG: hypothetical protein IKZ96_04210 [Bacilli bacterium]|nr:hypothetical protein [Bacilli bacterium]
MTELYAIKGKWKNIDDNDYSEDDVWTGKLLVEEDGWFEGIVRDEMEEDVDIFIFGIFKPDSRIEVHHISSYGYRRPLVYNGLLLKDIYIGKYSEDEDHEMYGDVIIETKDIDGPYFLCEAKELEKRIEEFKKYLLLNSRGLPIYKKARSNREEAYRIIYKHEAPKGADSFYEELEAEFFDTHITPLILDKKNS